MTPDEKPPIVDNGGGKIDEIHCPDPEVTADLAHSYTLTESPCCGAGIEVMMSGCFRCSECHGKWIYNE